MKIAIVGAGLSGSNVLKGLITHPNFDAGDEIDVFEYREVLGAGLPYHPTDDESIMLNTAPDVMSVDLDNPNDFEEWLDANYEEPYNFEQLVSRPKYGKYLLERFAPFYNHKQVHHIQSTVEDLLVLDAETQEPASETSSGQYVYRVKTNAGWEDTIYDAVFFSVGHPAYNDFYDLKDEKNFIHNPYPMNEKLIEFENSDKVAVIGTGATGIDLMRFFFTNYNLEKPLAFYDVKEPFFCVNIPFEKEEATYSLTKEWVDREKEKHGGFIPLAFMLDTVKADLANEDADTMAVYNRYKARTLEVYRHAFETKDQELAAVQKYASQMVGNLPHLYNALNGEDRDTYMKDYHEIMTFFKAKVPYNSYKWLFDLVDAGKLEAYSGLEDVDVLEGGRFKVTTDVQSDEVDILVNATGFNSNLARLAKDSTLIHNLYNQRIILPHVEGKFVLVDWPHCRVMNQRFGVMDNLFFLGLLIGGTQHENNDGGQTIEQANFTAKTFMDQRK